MKEMPKSMKNFIAKHEIDSRIDNLLFNLLAENGMELVASPKFYTWGSVDVHAVKTEDAGWNGSCTTYKVTILIENDIPTRILKSVEL